MGRGALLCPGGDLEAWRRVLPSGTGAWRMMHEVPGPSPRAVSARCISWAGQVGNLQQVGSAGLSHSTTECMCALHALPCTPQDGSVPPHMMPTQDRLPAEQLIANAVRQVRIEWAMI